MTAIATLYKWFSDLKKPNGAQFRALIDSFFHKSEKIPMSSIDGLDRIIEGTASAQQLQNHLTDTNAHKGLFDGKVDKVEGKGLSSNDFTNAYKQQLDTLEDYDVELDESTTELKFKKGSNVIKRISLMFLDDEGTKLVYNKTNKTLELRDKRDNLLTSIPVSHFVSNIPTSIVVQNGKIKLMAGSEVIDENTISYNDLADKPNLDFLPLSGGTVTGDVSLSGDLLVKDKTKVHVRDNGNIVFGNKPFNDLVIGEFKGIQLWGQGNDKVILAGGGVTNLSELKNENVKVGGRNLMFNSEFVPFGSIATGAGISKINKDSEKISEFHVTSGNENWSTNNIQPKYIDNTLNEIVSVSFDIKVLEGTLKPPTYYPGSFSPYLNLKPIYGDTIELNKWVRVGVTFVSKAGWQPHLGWSELAGKYQLKNFKIEYGNTPTDWSPAPEDLATAEELIRKITRAGYEVGADTVIPQAQQNDTVFVKASCTLGLQKIEHLGNTSFRKVFDGGSIIFTCAGKNIIYTGDNTFNGKKGSTAVVSTYDNDCYIDIRNI